MLKKYGKKILARKFYLNGTLSILFYLLKYFYQFNLNILKLKNLKENQFYFKIKIYYKLFKFINKFSTIYHYPIIL